VAIAADGSYETPASAVSWAAIIGGAVAAAAITVLLLALGTGIGLSSVSPWSYSNPTATTFSLLAAVWLILVQWLSSAAGGYLAGRMRTQWVGIHTDEVFFRDTVHGFLSWGLATVMVAIVATSAVTSAAGTGAQAAASLIGGAASGVAQGAANQSAATTSYFSDALFRSDQPKPDAPPAQASGEAARILTQSTANGKLEPNDRAYLARLVATRTGLSQQDAEKRVDDVAAQMNAAKEKAKEAADAARKAGATGSFFTFFSMLIGAFIAAAAGALGGRQRDDVS